MDHLSESSKGFLYTTLAYLSWGFFPLYFPLLEPANPLEILAQRMAWSLVVMVIILRASGGFAGVRAVAANWAQLRWLILAAVLIAVNWGLYIWSVNSGHILETSLGYFITPLVSVLLGVLLFGEQLRPAQWAAIGLTVVAIAVIAIDYGRLPWIALSLAASFGIYGLAKKRAGAGAADSLAIETGVQFLPAVITLAVMSAQGNLVFGHASVANTTLLALSGLLTAVPLMLFAAGTRRLPLTVLGMLQYLAPLLQFMVAIWIRHETLATAQLIGFCIVWISVLALAADALRARGQAPARGDVVTENPEDHIAERGVTDRR